MKHTGLIVCAAPAPGAQDVVRRLAPAADVVIAVDGGAVTCVEAGVTPSSVVGDLDSLDSATAAALRGAGVEFHVFSAEKDETDLDLALAESRKLGCTSVWVTGAFTGRLDHTLAAVGSVGQSADLMPMIVEPHQMGWVLAPDHRSSVEIDTAGTTFSVIALSDIATVSVQEAQWPLDHVEIVRLSSRGISNVALGERACVTVHRGRVLVIAQIAPDMAS